MWLQWIRGSTIDEVKWSSRHKFCLISIEKLWKDKFGLLKILKFDKFGVIYLFEIAFQNFETNLLWKGWKTFHPNRSESFITFFDGKRDFRFGHLESAKPRLRSLRYQSIRVSGVEADKQTRICVWSIQAITSANQDQKLSPQVWPKSFNFGPNYLIFAPKSDTKMFSKQIF